jgi:pimeloyl-ACP methyl ester carboxylesterase
MEAYADRVAAWAREQGIGGLALAGHSMGGYVALAFARKYGTMLRALILVCTRPVADSEAAREGRYKLAKEVEERGPQAVVDSMLPKLFAPTDDQPGEAADVVVEAMLDQSKEGITEALHAMARRPDSTPLLREITVPTLLITGAQDAIIPATDAETMLAQIPNARHTSVERAGHMPMLENPRDFESALRDFLAQL